jgi:uncharacterized protein
VLRMTAAVRRLVVVATTLLLTAGLLGGCAQRFEDLRLSMTTGSSLAVYHQLGTVLARSWAAELGMPMPVVRTSAGSGENLGRLLVGEADVGLAAADAAAARRLRPGGEHLRALARVHDDYLQVVVPRNSRVNTLFDLRGLRVSVGPANSGVRLVAERLLATAELAGATDIQRRELSVDQAPEALSTGSIDAFFWSGGIETESISRLAQRSPIRLIDLSDVLPAIRGAYPEYETATIPASAYELGSPVTTLRLPNFLLVTDRMSPEVAEALTRGLFNARPALAAANPAARSIDIWAGIETIPIPLHDGAVNYYRSLT